jgi:hypothetical protein
LIGERQIQHDFWIAVEESGQDRDDAMGGEGDVRIDRQGPPRLQRFRGHRPLRFVHVGDDALGAMIVGAAFGRQLKTARRSQDQRRSQPLLEPRDQLADGRRRHLEIARGGRKAAQLDDADEHFHFAKAVPQSSNLGQPRCSAVLRPKCLS